MNLRGLKEKLEGKKDELPDKNKLGMLRQLNVNYTGMYAGTVPPGVVRERRIRNKAARRARRVQRMNRK